MKKWLILFGLLILAPYSRAQQAVVGASCAASGLNAIATNGQPVLCTQNGAGLLVWTGVPGSGNSGSGGGLPTTSTTQLPEQATLLAAFWFPSTDNPCTPTDYSGHGNNGIGCPGPGNAIIQNSYPLAGGLGCGFNGTPVKMAAALTSAQTYSFVTRSFGFSGITSSQDIIAGNGNLSLGHTFALRFDKTQFTAPNGSPGWGINTVSSSTGSGPAIKVVSSAAVPFVYQTVTVVLSDPLHSNSDAVYVDGNWIGNFTAGASLGSAIGNMQLCGSANGQGISGTDWYYGEIMFFAAWSGPLGVTDNKQVDAVAKANLAARGVDLNCSFFNSNCTSFNPANIGKDPDVVRWDGDSQCFNGDFGPVTLVPRGGAILTQYNFCLTSQPLGSVVQSIFPALRSIFNPNNMRNTAIVEGGYDDSGPSNDAYAAMFRQYCAAAHAANGKCIVETLMDSTGTDTKKNTMLTEMLPAYPAIYDEVADVADWAEMGADGAAGNATNMPDGVHPATFLQENARMPSLQAAYNRLWSANSNWSSPTVYSAAAGSAATTAGSAVGNTYTVTMAATPANCVKSKFAFITGTTAATVANAYNSDHTAGKPLGWFIQTANATTITFYSGITTPGAITVQGTVSCPLIQDSDLYVNTTFSGNITLPPCEIFAGRTVMIKNTSGGADTLVPFGAETVDNSSIAAGAIAAVTSVRGTPSAAGCSWRTTFGF